jgi:hypothetical protein
MNTTTISWILTGILCLAFLGAAYIVSMDRDTLSISLFVVAAMLVCPLLNGLYRNSKFLKSAVARTGLALVFCGILYIPALNGSSNEAGAIVRSSPVKDNPHPRQPGYYNSPWPGEDGGYERLQVSYDTNGNPVTGLNITENTEISTTSRSLGMTGSAAALRDPGQLYLQTSSFIRTKLGLPAYANIELIDPVTLKTIKKSPALKAGEAWPGGMAIHKNGDIYSVYGNWVHRLDADLNLIKSYELPQQLPYNSFIILDNGYLVTKSISEDKSVMTILNPETLEPVTEHIELHEPSIARISGRGNSIYIVGTRSIFRYNWDEQQNSPVLDKDWIFDYIGDTNKTYGWDPVLGPDNAWFLDNGHHNFFENDLSLVGAGLGEGVVTLVRVSLTDATDTSIVPISGIPYGTVSNTAVYAPDRHIAIGYDAGNKVMTAFKFSPETGELTQIWKKEDFGVGGHMIYYPDTGELTSNDYDSGVADTGVILDIETGNEKARIENITNNVHYGLFPTAGWGRDFYYVNFDKLVRVYVEE